MKTIILSAAVAAMTLASGAASAQTYSGYGQRGYDRRGYDQSQYRDSDRDGRSDAQEWGRDRDRDGRPDQYDRNDNRYDGHRGNAYGHDRGHQYRGQGRWRQGQVYSYYRQPSYVISDYRAYRLPPPQHGYRYYRGDNGDVLLVAIASGLIGAVLAGGLNDHDDHRGYEGGYRY